MGVTTYFFKDYIFSKTLFQLEVVIYWRDYVYTMHLFIAEKPGLLHSVIGEMTVI